MRNLATNHNIKTNISAKKESMKYVIGMCFLFALLILGRAVSDIFFYVFAAVSLGVFLVSSVAHSFSLLLFLLPFTSILKPYVGSVSFFTILYFVVVLKMLFKKATISMKLFIALVLFAVYSLCFSGLETITIIVTMIFGMLMLYYLQSTELNVDLAILAFSLGIILSSILALLKTSFPIVNLFVSDAAIKLGSNQYAVRFTGLCGNPNYYTLDIIVALAAIVVLMYRRSKSLTNTICFIALSVFGLMSVSKSFLLSWLLLIACWFILSIKQGAGKFIKFVMIAIIAGTAVYLYAFDSINAYLFRFIEDGSSLSDMTTGRTDIWESYINEILNNMKIFFLGNGLNTTIASGMGAHNAFIETLFSLGIIGGGLFLVSVKVSMGKIISKPVMLVPVIILFVRMLAIGMLTYDNLWLYLAIIVCLSKFVRKTEGEVQSEKVHRADIL